MPDRVEEKVSWLNSQIRSRRDWLATHGTRKRPWPESDMEAKRHGLVMMMDIRDDYQESLDRERVSV